MNQKARNKQGVEILAAIGFATLSGIVLMLVGVSVLAWLLSTEKIAEEAMRYGVLFIDILSAIAASSMAIRFTHQHILPISVSASLCFAIVLLGINALFFDGSYQGVGVTLLTILGTGVGVALVALKYQNKPRKYYKKR